MMAPEHERARLLAIAIQRAVEVLQAPITKIEVTADTVVCSAGARVLTLRYGYADAIGETGVAMPGSGQWWVAVEGERVRGETDVPRALGRVAGKWLRGRGLLP